MHASKHLEESSITAMTEMLAFARRSGENINSLLARYETVRQRAALEGQFVMTVAGCSLQILKACGMGPQHLFILLQPFQGRLPSTDAQFRELCTQLRRYGHIQEHAPGNIASTLSEPARQARPGAYLAQGSQQQLRDAFERSRSSQGTATFLSGTQNGQGTLDNALTQGLLQPDPYAPWQQDTQDYLPLPEAGHSVTADPAAQMVPGDTMGTYAADTMDAEDDSTSATSSDDGEEDDDMPDLSRMSNADAAVT